MAVSFSLSPSVEVKEIDLTNIIPAVASGIGGFAGSFEWGPVEEPVTVGSIAELKNRFGLPRIVTSNSSYFNQKEWYSVANFLDYSNNCKVVRSTADGLANASSGNRLIGTWRSEGTFVPADMSEIKYVLTASGNVTGTNAAGTMQRFDIKVSGTAAGSAVPGVRKRDRITVTSGPAFSNVATAQRETVSFSGIASATGIIYITAGNYVIPVGVSAGDSSSVIATKVSNVLQAYTSPRIVDPGMMVQSAGMLTYTRDTAGSSIAEGSGVDVSTGMVRHLVFDTSMVPGISASVVVDVIANDTNAENVVVYHIVGEPAARYLTVRSSETSIQVAQNLGNIIRNLPFIYNGLDNPVKIVGNTVEYSYSELTASPPHEITALVSPVSAYFYTFVTLVAGSEPIAAIPQEITITHSDSVVQTITVPGGATSAKIVASLLSNASGYVHTGSNVWNTSLKPGTVDTVIFTAPLAMSNVPKTQFQIEPSLGVGFTASGPLGLAPFTVFENVEPTTDTGTGTGLKLTITLDSTGNGIGSVVVSDKGTGYAVTDQSSVANFEGTGVTLTFTITDVAYPVSFTVVGEVAGSYPNSASIQVNGLTINVEEGNTPADIYDEFMFACGAVSAPEIAPVVFNNTGDTLEVVTNGTETVAGMPIEPLFVEAYGMRIEWAPYIDVPAHWDIADHTRFVSTEDYSLLISRQVQPGDTVVLSDGTHSITGTFAEVSANAITIIHTDVGGYVGLPDLAPETLVEPTGYYPPAEILIDSTILIKNDAHWESIKHVVNGGIFYAKFPGSKGNNLGVAMVDALQSEEEYKQATFGPGILFDKIFEARPGSSVFSQSNGSGYNDELHVVVYDATGFLTGSKGTILEIYPFLSKNLTGRALDGSANYYVDVINAKSKFIKVKDGFMGEGMISLDQTSGVYNWGDNVVAGDSGSYKLLERPGVFRLFGGTDDLSSVTDVMNAYDVLKDVEQVDVSLFITGPHPKVVCKHVADIAVTRMDAMVCVSPDEFSGLYNPTSEKIVYYFNNDVDGFQSTSYAVFDSGFKYQYDRINNTYIWMPLNPDIAGLISRTEYVAEPWSSPAGYNRGFLKNVIKLSFNPNKTHRDELYKNRINPVVTFVGQGTLLYGDKTAQTRPSAFDRINVRRLFIILEKSIATAAKYTLFEFNDEFTRNRFIAMIEPYLRNVKGRRGLTDYKVICDDSNNTPEVINSNGFVADIYIRPAYSINFISLNFIAVKQGVEFSEVLINNG